MVKDKFNNSQKEKNDNVVEQNQDNENKEGETVEEKTDKQNQQSKKSQKEKSTEYQTDDSGQSEVSREELNQQIENLQRENQQLKEQNDKNLNQLRRLQADFDNYKKRVTKEWDQKSAEKAKDMAAQLLPIMDNFERALNNADLEKVENNFYEGIKMIYDQLNEIMENNGLERIEAEGQKFDPNYHEAVMQVDSDECESNIVVEELQPGFLFQGKLLRASVVKVSK